MSNFTECPEDVKEGSAVGGTLPCPRTSKKATQEGAVAGGWEEGAPQEPRDTGPIEAQRGGWPLF